MIVLTSTQMRELRAVAHCAFEAQAAQRALVASHRTQVEFLRVLKARLQERVNAKASEMYGRTPEDQRALTSTFAPQLLELQQRIDAAEKEIQQLKARLHIATSVSAPLDAVVGRVLRHVGRSARDLGVDFGVDYQSDRGPPTIITLGAAQ